MDIYFIFKVFGSILINNSLQVKLSFALINRYENHMIFMKKNEKRQKKQMKNSSTKGVMFIQPSIPKSEDIWKNVKIEANGGDWRNEYKKSKIGYLKKFLRN